MNPDDQPGPSKKLPPGQEDRAADAAQDGNDESPFRPTYLDYTAIGFLLLVLTNAGRFRGAYGAERVFWIWGFCLGALVLMAILFRFGRHQAQIALNERAAEGLQSARDVVLYLRPFMTGGKLYVRNAMKRFADRMLMGFHWDAELALSLALEGKARLIAIGGGAESLGAAKLTVDDAGWVEMMQKCAQRAFAIVVVPLSRPSTMWEVSYLFRTPDLLAKTLFFMPPTSYGVWQWLAWLRNGKPSTLWEKARADCASRGVHLPEYRSEGCWFRIDSSGKATLTLPLADMDPAHTYTIISSITERDARSIDQRLEHVEKTVLQPGRSEAEDAARRARERMIGLILLWVMLVVVINFFLYQWLFV